MFWGPGMGKHIANTGDLLFAGEAIRTICEERNAKLLVMDPLSGAFGGNENDRTAVLRLRVPPSAAGAMPPNAHSSSSDTSQKGPRGAPQDFPEAPLGKPLPDPCGCYQSRTQAIAKTRKNTGHCCTQKQTTHHFKMRNPLSNPNTAERYKHSPLAI